jgi:lysozyme family protein
MLGNLPNCLSITLKFEGGYVNNPHDPGGPTNLGVTQVTLSHELGRAATIAEVKALTPETVEPIYHKKYWNLIDGDNLPKGLDLIAFDIAVNSGPGRANQFLNECKGQSTINRIRYLDNSRRSFWKHLSSFRWFGKGWMTRENFVLSEALKMAS